LADNAKPSPGGATQAESTLFHKAMTGTWAGSFSAITL